MLLVLQKRTGHEPDTWEDLQIHELDRDKAVDGVAERLRDLEADGIYRATFSNGGLFQIQVYRVESREVVIHDLRDAE